MGRYQIRLVGKDAKLGEVAAVDVARLIFGVQTAVARAAGSAIGRRPKATGRWEGIVEEATKLRLVRIKRGSVILELEPPHAAPSDGELDLDVESLGDIGWNTAIAAISNTEEADSDVTARLLTLADSLAIGSRFDAIEFRSDEGASVRMDGDKRGHLRQVLRERTLGNRPPESVTGVLFEADFERHSAKVRTQAGGVVEVVFDDDQADSIKEALREASEFEGDVTFDPVTAAVRSVRLRRLTRFEQLLFGDDGARAFWQSTTFDELATQQGAMPIVSFGDLKDTTIEDDDYENFIEALS